MQDESDVYVSFHSPNEVLTFEEEQAHTQLMDKYLSEVKAERKVSGKREWALLGFQSPLWSTPFTQEFGAHF